jgi:hypothetical protein
MDGPWPWLRPTGKKEDCEVSEAGALLADDRVQLANALITADPLHNKHDTIQIILQKGGDYLVGTKENTSRRLKGANRALKDSPFLN